MKSADLHKVWSAPDNTRLTGKQYSFRLPVHVAAKINALCEIYPNKTKTEIVGDLLSTALDDLVAGLPARPGRFLGAHPEEGELYEEDGLVAEFRRRANRHYKELERELGNEAAPDLYGDNFVVGKEGM